MSTARIGTPEWLAWNEAENAKGKRKDEQKARQITNLLVDPQSSRRPACHSDALAAIFRMEEDNDLFNAKYHKNAEMRKKLGRFADAMRQAEVAWKEIMCTTDASTTSVGVLGRRTNNESVTREMTHNAEAVSDALAFGRFCRKLADDRQERMPNKNAWMKSQAVKHAYNLVTKYGLKPSAKNDSPFCRIAKLLHGGSVNLTKLCKTHAAERSTLRARRKAKRSSA